MSRRDDLLALRRADRARADFHAIADKLDFVKLQLWRLPTRRDIAHTALASSSPAAALDILWFEAFWRHRL
jgi:hypothetical protein